MSEGNQRAYHTLFILTAMHFFQHLDKAAIQVTQEMIKHEFGLSDAQVGLMAGFSYGAGFALMGLPLGYLIDRTHRVKLLASLLAIWSGITVVCGVATSFWQLIVTRTFLGAAEAGAVPGGLSILSNVFPPERRAAVTSIFFSAVSLGAVTSFAAGGFIATQFGWRSVFFIYGLPGFIIAALLWFTVREPARERPQSATPIAFRAAAALIVRDPVLVALYVTATFWTMAISGVASWLFPYWIRVHNFAPPMAGLAVAGGFAVFGGLGSVAFGFLADRVDRREKGRMLLVLTGVGLANGALAISAAWVDQTLAALVLFCAWGLTALTYSGTINAVIARRAHPDTLGMAFAVYVILGTLIGGGVGPLLVGIFSDHFAGPFGASSLRPAFAMIALLQVPAAIALFVAYRMIREPAAAPGPVVA